ncbi:MAG: enoyl-CoA hydratase/isomerase family protein, partial [Betaproteobacteria bacterium]|nr:enoyl-CoA hydratase/isomerase family protein [Betaproteobacteria bacterium]
MSSFSDYKDAFQTIKLERTESGILQVTLHTDGGPWQWDARAQADGRAGVPFQELADATNQIARDAGNRVVIITGTGNQFSGPVASRHTMSRGDVKHWDRVQFLGSSTMMDLLDIPGPVISCLNGPAYRHAEIALIADIVLAADDALVQDSAHFPNRMVPGDGIGVLFPHLMGPNRGRYFHLTGQKLSAAELKEIGVVNEIMPRERLLPRAWELAEQLIQNNPYVLRYTRLLLTAPLKALLRQHLHYGFAMEALAAVDES